MKKVIFVFILLLSLFSINAYADNRTGTLSIKTTNNY